jgi:hypothetical protein
LTLTSQEPGAFDHFYIRHERLVLADFRRRTPSADVAVDLTAETFVAPLPRPDDLLLAASQPSRGCSGSRAIGC